MVSEIGTLLVRSYSVDDAKCLKDAFDSFIKENTNFNEEVEDSQINDSSYEFEIDTFDIFDDPMETSIFEKDILV